MASKEHKIVRRAEALSELSRLSGLLAEHLQMPAPEMQIHGSDSDLVEIQRIENVNALLSRVLEAYKEDTDQDLAKFDAERSEMKERMRRSARRTSGKVV